MLPACLREGAPEDVLRHLESRSADVIVGMANGEPVAAIDVLEREHERLHDVRVLQMHALRRRPSIDGECGRHLRHVSLFLSAATRDAFAAGRCDVLPTDFSAVPQLLRRSTRRSLLVTAVSPPDADGWCTLGANADYIAALHGDTPTILEVNERMPHTCGANRIHLSEAVAWYRSDRPLVETPRPRRADRDRAIGALIASRVPDGSTIQIGIGSVPDAVLDALSGHRELGVHSELISDGVMDLVERGVVTGSRKRFLPGIVVATFALGTDRFHRWLDRNDAVGFHPVDWVNDQRTIAAEPGMISINATTEVDLFGQCASETMAGRPWSGSGGQADFARGAIASPGGEAFVVLHATTSTGRSRIRATLTEGSIVTTSKNDVDHVVTEWGVATLRGRTLAQRARALIGVAAPEHRDDLERAARTRGILPPSSTSSSPAVRPRRPSRTSVDPGTPTSDQPVLVVFASTHGHTRTIVSRLAQRLRGHGLVVVTTEADARPAPDPRRYGSVVMVGSVHAGRHQRSLVRWMRRHAEAVNARPCAIASVSLSAADPSLQAVDSTRALVAELGRLTGVRPDRSACIAGALQYRAYNPFVRILMRRIARKQGAPTDTSVDVELTDWPAVERFGDEVAALAAGVPRPTTHDPAGAAAGAAVSPPGAPSR